MRRLRTTLIALAAVLILLATAFLFYTNLESYGERGPAILAWQDPEVVITSTDHSIVLEPAIGASGTGLVFIPGAKVDPYAYLYKLSGIVGETGLTVVITKPTLNLAFFDTRPLSTFTNDAPEVTSWLVGGHSLGGVRACQLAELAEVDGLVLFGSYCANDLAGSGLDVLSISGSNDALSTPQKIQDAANLLPAGTEYVQIEGLNHAGFGDYGVQSGDGEPSLTSVEERTTITAALAEYLKVRAG